MSVNKDVYVQAENDRYAIETRQLVRRQLKMIDELQKDIYEANRNAIAAMVLAAISVVFTAFMGFTFIF